MRKIKLDEWIEEGSSLPREKVKKGRSTKDWELSNSIRFIDMRDKYLRKEGILVKKDDRKWRLNLDLSS